VRYAAFNLAVGTALVAWVFIVVGPAAADPYKWCAQFNISGGSNCGFVTYEQCRAAISGMGRNLHTKPIPGGAGPSAHEEKNTLMCGG